MKTIFTGILSAAVAILAGCSPADKVLRANPSSIEMAAEPEDISVAVESSSSWIFDSSVLEDWLSLKYDNDDPSLLWVSAEANESLGERTDSIMLISGDGSKLIIPLRQLAMEISFDVSPAVLEPFGASDEEPRTLTISTNLTSGWNYTILHAADWLTAEIGGKGEENILTVSAKSNQSLYERRDTIVVRPTNAVFSALADSIAVVQTGLDLLVTSGSMDEETYIIKIPTEGGETNLSVWSRSPWSVSTEADAEKVSTNLAEGGADIVDGITVVVTVVPNTETEEYTFTLVFESAGQKYEYRFVQAGIELEPEPNPEPKPDSE